MKDNKIYPTYYKETYFNYPIMVELITPAKNTEFNIGDYVRFHGWKYGQIIGLTTGSFDKYYKVKDLYGVIAVYAKGYDNMIKITKKEYDHFSLMCGSGNALTSKFTRQARC